MYCSRHLIATPLLLFALASAHAANWRMLVDDSGRRTAFAVVGATRVSAGKGVTLRVLVADTPKVKSTFIKGRGFSWIVLERVARVAGADRVLSSMTLKKPTVDSVGVLRRGGAKLMSIEVRTTAS